MKKVLAAAVAALVLGLAVGGMLFLGAEPALPGRPDPSRALAGGVPDDPAPIGRMPVVPTSGEVPATPVHGVLLHADGTPAARVPFWVWEDPAPPWTRVPDRSRFVYGWSLPEVPEGRTGIEGEWRIESGDAAAVTFVPFETIMVSYELDGQDSTEGGVRWDLPPFALSHFEILGLRPDEHWMVQLWPTVDPSEDPGDTTPESGPHLLVPHGEDGQRAALSLLGSSGDTGRRLTGPSRVSFVTIPGRTYQREVIGVGFETEQPPLDYFMAPFAESLRIARRGPKVTVRVMEAGGVIATGEEGRVVYWKERDRQFGRMDWPLRSGRADFGWGCFPAEVPHEVRVVMADGEQFSGAFRFSPGEMERVLTFERGQGSLPTLSVVLPDDADLTACTVVFEDHRGQFDDVKPYGKQMFDLIAIGRKTEATFTESGSHTLRLNKMPDGWVQLWVLTPAGRVANLRNPGSAGTVRVPWLPDTELEALDLHQPIDEGALRPGSDFLFRIEFTTTSGEVRMRTVDRFDSTADTYLWPVWRKRVPEGMGYRVFAFGSGGRAEFDLQRR